MSSASRRSRFSFAISAKKLERQELGHRLSGVVGRYVNAVLGTRIERAASLEQCCKPVRISRQRPVIGYGHAFLHDAEIGVEPYCHAVFVQQLDVVLAGKGAPSHREDGRNTAANDVDALHKRLGFYAPELLFAEP